MNKQQRQRFSPEGVAVTGAPAAGQRSAAIMRAVIESLMVSPRAARGRASTFHWRSRAAC